MQATSKNSRINKWGNWSITRLVILVTSAFVLCFVLSCGPVKKAADTGTGKVKDNNLFNLRAAQQKADTVAIRQFLAGNWTLNSMCRSSFVGLKCDTTIRQSWQLDSLGRISWLTAGDAAGKDNYHFVARTGAQAGTAKSDTAWILFLDQGRRGYLIQALTKDSLTIAEYPLIMDNTTTYYLSR